MVKRLVADLNTMWYRLAPFARIQCHSWWAFYDYSVQLVEINLWLVCDLSSCWCFELTLADYSSKPKCL